MRRAVRACARVQLVAQRNINGHAVVPRLYRPKTVSTQTVRQLRDAFFAGVLRAVSVEVFKQGQLNAKKAGLTAVWYAVDVLIDVNIAANV